MTTEEAIKALRLMEHVESIAATYESGETGGSTTVRELKEACRVAADALNAQQAHTMDRSQWEGGGYCVDVAPEWCPWNFCPNCGRPLTEAAWAELERRINGG